MLNVSYTLIKKMLQGAKKPGLAIVGTEEAIVGSH